jgi:hypothetical protein
MTAFIVSRLRGNKETVGAWGTTRIDLQYMVPDR